MTDRAMRLSRLRLSIPIVVGASLLVAGCGLNDPFERPGTWDAEGLNDSNIALMTTHPRDLVWGVNDPVSLGVLSAAAVERLRNDKTKQLSTTDIGSVDRGQGTAPAGGGAAAGGI